MSDETCARCKEVGDDRRTLWMACFYAMNELKVPFESVLMFSANLDDMSPAQEAKSITLKDGDKITLTPGTVTTKGELTPHNFFTLRVCKECRASWMSAIESWFNAGVARPNESVNSGIFVRRNGVNVEITQEEWDKLNPGREPTRVTKD